MAEGQRGESVKTNLLQTESIIQQIESQQIDITTAYSDWRNIGFAFADEFGETGREYFHRISRFYPDYSATDCDKQFDNCLKAKGQGVSLKTFFFHAKQAGINIFGTVSSPVLGTGQNPNREGVNLTTSNGTSSHFPRILVSSTS
ncbi:MAG: PriCT-2 domain-containing protein [Draconibacterium sp.]|nr:PriCT-2 domain-containing protein [Draconibacterium sp.]